MWIPFLIAILIALLLPSQSYSWSKLPVWSGWDGSTYWDTDMPVGAPGIPTNDQIITSWDNKIRLSDKLRNLFMQKKIVKTGVLYRDGKLKESWGIWDRNSRPYKILNDIAITIWSKFKEGLICVSYYPQFRVFSVILHPDKAKDIKLHSEIAKHLESVRIEKHKEYFGE